MRRFSIARSNGAISPRRSSSAPLEAREDRVDLGAVGGEKRLALGGQRIELAPALILGGGGVAHVLDQGQRGIDDAGARAVAAADPLFERLDDLVAVARLLGHQGENDEPEIAAVEHAPLARLEPAAAPVPAEPVPPAETVVRAPLAIESLK